MPITPHEAASRIYSGQSSEEMTYHEDAQTLARAFLATGTDREPGGYPKTIHTLPTRVKDHAVLRWALCKNRHGSYPGGYVLAVNEHEVQPYVVWRVCTPDGGETWQVDGSGEYCWTHAEAVTAFTRRSDGSDIAQIPLTEADPYRHTCPVCKS